MKGIATACMTAGLATLPTTKIEASSFVEVPIVQFDSKSDAVAVRKHPLAKSLESLGVTIHARRNPKGTGYYLLVPDTARSTTSGRYKASGTTILEYLCNDLVNGHETRVEALIIRIAMRHALAKTPPLWNLLHELPETEKDLTTTCGVIRGAIEK